MKIKVEDLIKVLEENFEGEVELKIGSGKREYPVAEIMGGCLGGKIVFCTDGYVNWKRKQQMVY